MCLGRQEVSSAEETSQAGRDRREAAAGRCVGFAESIGRGRGEGDRRYRGHVLSLAPEFGGLKSDQVKRLKNLETENTRLRRAVSDLTLDKMILAEAARGNF